jgi:epimerase transport system membrane fusion protein
LLKSELTLLPGMPAEVLINTGERTMLEYLFDPLTDAVARSFIED